MSEMDAAAVASAAECVPALPQDIIAEILTRVPPDVAFLFRCAVVCKQWCRLLTDPAFLRRLLPESDRSSSSLLGFIVERLPLSTEQRETTILLLARAPAFVLAPGLALGPGHRTLPSFIRGDAGVLDHAEPLAAHDGLLLLRVSPCSADHKVLHLCVCNLLTGRLDVLPPLNTVLFDGEGVSGYAIVTAANHAATAWHRPADGYSTFFQLLLIAVHHCDKLVYLHRFSSANLASRNWIASPTNFFHGNKKHLSCGPRAATVCLGTAYWLFWWGARLYTHGVSLNTWHVCTTKISIDAHYWSSARLCSSIHARLSLVYVSENYLVIWTQRDGDLGNTAGWRFNQVIVVSMKSWLSSRVNSLATVCVGEKSGTAFVLYDSNPDSVYLVDLQSRSKTKLTSWNKSFNHMTAVPYEINWPVFFMSRHGTRL